jgi:hypothetical protein
VNYQGLVERVRGEFLEMPGLSLTRAEACRLWGVDVRACEHVITALIGAAFLRWTPKGRLVRTDD